MQGSSKYLPLTVLVMAVAFAVFQAWQLGAQYQRQATSLASNALDFETINLRIAAALSELGTLPRAAEPLGAGQLAASANEEAASTLYLSTVRNEAAAIGVELLTSQFALQRGQDRRSTVRVAIRAILTEEALLTLSTRLEQGPLALRFESFDLQPPAGGAMGELLEFNAVLIGDHDVAS